MVQPPVWHFPRFLTIVISTERVNRNLFQVIGTAPITNIQTADRQINLKHHQSEYPIDVPQEISWFQNPMVGGLIISKELATDYPHVYMIYHMQQMLHFTEKENESVKTIST